LSGESVLVELFRLGVDNTPVSYKTREALVASIRQYIAGEHKTFDHALGLNGKKGSRKASTRVRLAIRDFHIKGAMDSISGCGSFSDVDDANQFHEELQLFLFSEWPRSKNYSIPPSRLKGIRKHLFYAMKTGLSMPQSTRGVIEAWKRAGTTNFQISEIISTE